MSVRSIPRWVWFTGALLIPGVAFAATSAAGGDVCGSLCMTVCSFVGYCPCG